MDGSSIINLNVSLGHDGVRGDNPAVPDKSYKAVSAWKKNENDHRIIVEGVSFTVAVLSFVLSVYYVEGTKAVLPGDGGHGGYAGYGGTEGKTFLVGVEQDPIFGITNKIGIDSILLTEPLWQIKEYSQMNLPSINKFM